jgi:hypothetical protein
MSMPMAMATSVQDARPWLVGPPSPRHPSTIRDR